MAKKTDPETYKITIINAPENTAYSLYFDGINQIITNGNTTGNSYSFTVPFQYQGTGRIKFMVRQRTRISAGVPFTIEIKADGKDLTVDIPPELWGGAPTSSEPGPTPKIAATKKGGKKLITNKLREQVQEKEEEIAKVETAPEPAAPEPGPTETGKKLITNKLREQVQKKKKELDTTGEEQNNDKGQTKSSDKGFWDSFK